MEALGLLAVVLVVLVSAVQAVRRDTRFDRREVLIHSAWLAAYLAGCALLALALIPLGRRIGAGAATAFGILTIALSMVVLARYLQRRLARRGL